MLVIVCPLSFLLRLWLSAAERKVRAAWPAGGATHQQRVERVQEAVRRHQRVQADGGGRQRMLCTARAGWQNLSTRFSDYKEHSDRIYVGDMLDVLDLDEDRLE